MSLKGVTFSGQLVTPEDDGSVYNAHYGDGILNGCSMAISGNNLNIGSGHLIAGGRVCHVDGTTSVSLSGHGLTNGYIQVILNYDTTRPAGSQWFTSNVSSATTTFPALTQQDINLTGSTYQMQLAVVQVSGGSPSTITTGLGKSRLVSETGADFNFSGSGGFIDLKNSGTAQGRLLLNSSGGVQVGHYNSGNIVNGVYAHNDGREIVFADSNSVQIRPNGVNSTSGMVEFTTAGQQIGGHGVVSKDVATVSIPSGNTVTNLLSVTGLDAGGLYLVFGHCSFGHTNSDTGYARLILGSTSSGVSLAQSVYCAGTGDRNISLSRFVTGVAAQYLNFSSSYAGSAKSFHMSVVRLG